VRKHPPEQVHKHRRRRNKSLGPLELQRLVLKLAQVLLPPLHPLIVKTTNVDARRFRLKDLMEGEYHLRISMAVEEL
jgi:hypothetical protein